MITLFYSNDLMELLYGFEKIILVGYWSAILFKKNELFSMNR